MPLYPPSRVQVMPTMAQPSADSKAPHAACRGACQQSQSIMYIPRAHIVAIARSWKGTPYHHQQCRKHIGTDCLGLIRGVWRELYRFEPETPPPYSRDWAEASGRETLLEATRRSLIEIDPKTAWDGDIMVFRYRKGCPAKHVGILAESGHMIHAIESIKVSEVSLSPWWTRRRIAAFSFPGAEPALR
jgi:NlpC/P60 family putative phage cell wall peptidase